MTAPRGLHELPAPPDELAELSQRLGERISAEIDANGPMPFDRYMQLALYEPGLGYYVNGLHKFGAAGDFVTAPEQGRLFATALAGQIDEVTEALDADWTLLEIGAGSGVLVRDLLGALANPPARYLILETSAALREVQAETLAGLPDELAGRVAWIDTPPEQGFEGVIVANEVLDALPVARFEATADGPAELAVAHQPPSFGWARTAPRERLERACRALFEALPAPLAEGYRGEICLDLSGWLATVTAPLKRGAAFLIDYGYPRDEAYHPDRSDGSLVCHYRHRAHFDPFVWPGLTDLSAFVDFTAVAEAADACGLSVAGYTTQAGFLLALGAHEAVGRADDETERLRLSAEIKRLTLPGEMGEKFKVMALTRALERPLTGFELFDHRHRLG